MMQHPPRLFKPQEAAPTIPPAAPHRRTLDQPQHEPHPCNPASTPPQPPLAQLAASRLAVYERVRATGRANHLQARIPLTSGLNIANWRRLTAGHTDSDLCDYLEFGFPLGYEGPHVPTPTFKNHGSAEAYPDAVAQFIREESAHGSLIGPFDAQPFIPWTQVSPLMTRPKRGSTARRVIVDLSFPQGSSVNSFTPRETYCGTPQKLTLPSADTLQQQISTMQGPCYLYSCDVARAYRNIPLDPLAWPLCNIQFNGKFYIDTSLSFGARWSAAGCQRVTDAVKYIMAKAGHTVINYIDDIVGLAQTLDQATQGFLMLQRTLASLGLPEATSKACPPAPTIIWLGIEFDSVNRTMRIPQEKLSETIALVSHWLSRSEISIRQLRSLLGKLLHIAQCSRPARLFLNRILATYRDNSRLHVISINHHFRRDLQWFKDHLPQANGVYMMDTPRAAHSTLECDSCMTGGGAIWQSFCHHTEYPGFITDSPLSICHLEALNCVVSLKLWAPKMSGTTVQLLCDSMVTVHTLINAKGRDPFMLKCAREIWLICAKHAINLLPSHAPGTEMAGRADALSRRHLDSHYDKLCTDLITTSNLSPCSIDPYMFKLQQSL